jgi:hypothetical protein
MTILQIDTGDLARDIPRATLSLVGGTEPPERKTKTTMSTVTKMTSKTKRGAEIQVAVIPQEMVAGRVEIQYAASDIARANGCTHYRVVSSTGAIIAAGKANSEATYGTFGPT